MNDLGKLRHLIEHWSEHNEEHVKTYLEWAARAEELGSPDMAEVLRRIAAETEKLSELFKKGAQTLKNKDA